MVRVTAVIVALLSVAGVSAFAPARSALPSPPAYGARRRARGASSQLSMIDAGLVGSIASAAAVPSVFVGTGSWLLRDDTPGVPESELTGLLEENKPADDGEVDIYRDTLLRYAGYANEVGEAFGPIVPPVVVPASYGVAITYVAADTLDKAKKAYSSGKYTPESITNCAIIEGIDAFIWQIAASVALPGYTIHQIVAITILVLDALDLNDGPLKVLPTAIGLLTIPFIVKPLDELAEVGMDVTLRKLWAPYLESCEVSYEGIE
mmetsp:Transcript_9990/g.17826  ORF Transcript_9990/g.17826 Transcript_9990/m.17826 type:complete len:264 (+) Transcript_9990:174-965(+)|eukprot:CAMPEP_0205923372 /NCGR_PEP_ID=MMETSP1325-20131115/16107_1 /ASSEMBLY_ACC=CAM_ASM_000708 /TAXON_ID=236786 /ORGANISM="Florenciella sp., Strain RCC1007" /LENGTH=263 /DNA_ID=CAMNT_0053291577 /DNA_START=141 /DNA_END=932 /DNA_ORIENTATION=+